jgi:hypothetical protein
MSDDWFDCFIDFKPEGTRYRDLHQDGLGDFALDLTRTGGRHWAARTVQWLTEWLTVDIAPRLALTASSERHTQDRRGEAVCLLGHHLYEALFADPESRDLFESRLDAGPVRLNLRFHPGSDELARLPWEFLCRPGPDGPQFLATSAELVLSRVVPEPLSLERDGPLHVLVAVLQPSGGHYDTIVAKDALDAVGSLGPKFDSADPPGPGAGRDPVRWELMPEPVTYGALQARMSDESLPHPDVVHIIGHGEPDGLVFPAEQQRADLAALAAIEGESGSEKVAGDRVAQLFHSADSDARRPSLVVLETCSSGDAGNQLMSTAQEVLRAGALAVVAMQHRVRQDVAGRFTAAFYTSIGRGKTIGEAVRDGRIGIISGDDLSRRTHDEPYFGIPVYYIHDKDRRLLDTPPRVLAEAEPAVRSLAPEPATVRPWTCPGCRHERMKRFCQDCGWGVFCKECGSQLDAPYNYCPECSAAVPRPPKRPDPDVVVEFSRRAS